MYRTLPEYIGGIDEPTSYPIYILGISTSFTYSKVGTGNIGMYVAVRFSDMYLHLVPGTYVLGM